MVDATLPSRVGALAERSSQSLSRSLRKSSEACTRSSSELPLFRRKGITMEAFGRYGRVPMSCASDIVH